MSGATVETLGECLKAWEQTFLGDGMFIGMYGYSAPTQVPTGYNRILEDEELYFDSKPIIGYRSWDVVVDEKDNFLLMSLYHAATWPHYAAHSALCGAQYFVLSRERKPSVQHYLHLDADDPTKKCRGHYEHNPPDSRHECGIYAYKEIHVDRSELRCGNRRQRVSGEVYLWGKVLIHEDGYKAQYAYPKALWIPEKMAENVDFEEGDLLRGLSASYGVDWIPWPTKEGIA